MQYSQESINLAIGMEEGFHHLPPYFPPPSLEGSRTSCHAGGMVTNRVPNNTCQHSFFPWQEHPRSGYRTRHSCKSKRRVGKLIQVALTEHFRLTSHLAALIELKCARPASITYPISFSIPFFIMVEC